MEHAIAELPLGIFTTLVSIGAGAFITLSIAFCTTSFSEEQLKRIDKFTLVPLAFVAIGFIASFVHLASPFKAAGVLSGLGSSPLSNEIFVGVIFFLIALAYCVFALVGKLSLNTRKLFSIVVAIAALVFALFTGLAYVISTIASWYTPLTPLTMIGYCLLGGALLGTSILALADVLTDVRKTSFKSAMLVVTLAGALIAVVSFVVHIIMVGTLANSLIEGASLVSESMVVAGMFIAGAIVAAAIECFALIKGGSKWLVVAGAVIAVIAIFCARLAFYAMQMSVGF